MSDFKVGDYAWTWVDEYFPIEKVKILEIKEADPAKDKIFKTYVVEYVSDTAQELHKDNKHLWRDDLYHRPEDITSKILREVYRMYPGDKPCA